MQEYQVPVVLEFIVERVTNVSMGTEINNVNEFEEILCLDPSLTLDDV
jgi:tartronate-semialdehyde synthase